MTHRTGDPATWPSEPEVADELPIGCAAEEASRVLAAVPFSFHTFSLNAALSLYTPGVARDHGYRMASIPRRFAGMSVLDVGTFDGFYGFLAEHRGAKRVVAVDDGSTATGCATVGASSCRVARGCAPSRASSTRRCGTRTWMPTTCPGPTSASTSSSASASCTVLEPARTAPGPVLAPPATRPLADRDRGRPG